MAVHLSDAVQRVCDAFLAEEDRRFPPPDSRVNLRADTKHLAALTGLPDIWAPRVAALRGGTFLIVDRRSRLQPTDLVMDWGWATYALTPMH
jgi:hypothetical protein